MSSDPAAKLLGFLGADPSVHGHAAGPPPTAAPIVVDDHHAEVAAHADGLRALREQFAADPAAMLPQFRRVLGDAALTEADVRDHLALWIAALEQPGAFVDHVARGTLPIAAAKDSLAHRIVAYLHHTPAPTSDERAVLARLAAKYPAALGGLPVAVNPHVRQFEALDPFWVTMLPGRLAQGDWPLTLVEPFWQHRDEDPFVYPSGVPAGADTAVALFSDFGTGYYHSWAIARAIAARAYPFAFHCGDVYYAGSAAQFAHYYARPVEQIFAAGTKLFSIPENHELFGGGHAWQDFIAANHARTPQRGSYFCVTFADHVIVAIDVNWFGRQRYPEDPPFLRAWLAARLAEAGDRTVILLTGSAPYEAGSRAPSALLADLADFVAGGRVHLWVWGNDHYAGLFDRDVAKGCAFYGSCIGWGGFPGTRLAREQHAFAPPLWVEDAARFPAWTGMRADMTNNGWAEAKLSPGGGVTLTYVDWLGEVRCVAPFVRHGAALDLDRARFAAYLDEREREAGAPRFT